MTVPYDFSPVTSLQSELKKIPYASLGVGRFPRPSHDTMGFGIHRSGWSECVRSLAALPLNNIVIDDFIEQTISLSHGSFYHHEPFVAFFHYPPDDDLPDFIADQHAGLHRNLFKNKAWNQSLPYLRGAFAMTEHLATW